MVPLRLSTPFACPKQQKDVKSAKGLIKGTMAPMRNESLKEAIERAGGFHALGRHLGISWQAIQRWPQVPPRRVLAVERITGVPRSKLRPDIYPPG
jgi:hypothetical protein